jgi:hypothetical protein
MCSGTATDFDTVEMGNPRDRLASGDVAGLGRQRGDIFAISEFVAQLVLGEGQGALCRSTRPRACCSRCAQLKRGFRDVLRHQVRNALRPRQPDRGSSAPRRSACCATAGDSQWDRRAMTATSPSLNVN